MQFVIFWYVGFWVFICLGFFSWENSFNKGLDLLQCLNATNSYCLKMLHLATDMKTKGLLEMDLTVLHDFPSLPLPLFPSRITDASLIGRMQSVQVVLALWLHVLSCCTIMLTLPHRESAWKNPRSTLLVQATTKAIPLFWWPWKERFYRDGHLRADQLVWLKGSCMEASQWHIADLTVLRLGYCCSHPLFWKQKVKRKSYRILLPETGCINWL